MNVAWKSHFALICLKEYSNYTFSAYIDYHDSSNDPTISAANRAKHGIDVDEAQSLMDDPYQIERRQCHGWSSRFLAVGMTRASTGRLVLHIPERPDADQTVAARRQEIDHYESD